MKPIIEKETGERTETDDVVIPRPGVVLDPPDEPLRAALDLTDLLHPRDRTTRELKTGHLDPIMAAAAVGVPHDHDVVLAAQPSHKVVLDATHERLRAGASTVPAPENPAHPAHRETELRGDCLGIGRGRDGRRERSTTWEVGRERGMGKVACGSSGASSRSRFVGKAMCGLSVKRAVRACIEIPEDLFVAL